MLQGEEQSFLVVCVTYVNSIYEKFKLAGIYYIRTTFKQYSFLKNILMRTRVDRNLQ
jgi:hypothetical protein